MANDYTFLTLRYQPGRSRKQFVNLGAALYSPAQFLGGKFDFEINRLRALFNGVSKRKLAKTISQLNGAFNEWETLPEVSGLEEIARSIIPEDHGELCWSKVRHGSCEDFPAELARIYSEKVTNRLTTHTDVRRSEDTVWNHFAEPLDRLGLHQRFISKEIESLVGNHLFHHARYHDQVWHLYQPISLDSNDPTLILDRARLWLGRGIALSEASEKHRFFFLVGTADRPDERCERAIEQAVSLLKQIDPLRVTVIREGECERFAEALAGELALTA